MSLDVENCPRCGTLFRKIRQPVCPNCVKKIDEEYEKCYKFMRKKENRSCNVHDLSEATGVSLRQITQFILEGRLSIENNPNMGYECRSCGKTIREGTLCDSCLGKVKKMANYMQEDEQKRQSALEEERKRQAGLYQVGRDDPRKS